MHYLSNNITYEHIALTTRSFLELNLNSIGKTQFRHLNGSDKLWWFWLVECGHEVLHWNCKIASSKLTGVLLAWAKYLQTTWFRNKIPS